MIHKNKIFFPIFRFHEFFRSEKIENLSTSGLLWKVKNFGSILSPPPPSVFYDPQLQIIRCYIARYYVGK